MRKILYWGSLAVLGLASYWASSTFATPEDEIPLTSLVDSSLELTAIPYGKNLFVHGKLSYSHKQESRQFAWNLKIINNKRVVWEETYETMRAKKGVPLKPVFTEVLQLPPGRYTVVLGTYYVGKDPLGNRILTRPSVVRNRVIEM